MNYDPTSVRRYQRDLIRESYRRDLAHSRIRLRVEFELALGEAAFAERGITPALTENLDHIFALWRTT